MLHLPKELKNRSPSVIIIRHQNLFNTINIRWDDILSEQMVKDLHWKFKDRENIKLTVDA